MIRLSILLAAILLAWQPANVFAQRGYTALTAEFLASTSDLVVRAKIRELKIENYVPKNEEEERSAHNFRSVTVWLDVKHCFKGLTDESAQLQFQSLSVGSDERLTKLKELEVESYWFLNYKQNGDSGIQSLCPHSQYGLWKTVVEPPDTDAKHPPKMLLNVELQALNTKQRLESNLSNFLKSFTKPTASVELQISREIAGRSGMVQAVNSVLLPSNYLEIRDHNAR